MNKMGRSNNLPVIAGSEYPIGVQNFSELRKGGFIYVDKTPYINSLLSGKYFFLSRPRRFGKSLLLSTIEAYFLGYRHLFKGLALDTLTDKWDAHPVFHLDLNNREYKDEDSLRAELNANLEIWEAIYGDEKRDRAPEERFAYLIRRAYEITGRQVVILIDEYDKPLLNAIDRPELADKYRSLLKAFYSNLKSMDAFIRFAMLTGVARFSKVSIFSDLNNLRDISFSDEYAGICGIISDELEMNFQSGISALARKLSISREEALLKLRQNYDGYHFADNSPDVYNPFSLLNCFADNDIRRYWFASGTPDFLMTLLRRNFLDFREIAPVDIEKNQLISAGLLSPDPIPVFYQTGYLTIKHYDSEFNLYTLDYPNEEVKHGFLDFLLHEYIPDFTSQRGFSIPDFLKDVRQGNAESFMRRMESLVAAVPYSEKGSAEAHFQNAVYLLFTLLGFYTRMEERTAEGRIDIKVETSTHIFIFEFKVDSTPEKAIDQILHRHYWLPDAASDKKIVLIGANFNTETRRRDPPPIIRHLPS